jgi:hypothetical protein
MSGRAYYFGCWRDVGHYFFGPHMARLGRDERAESIVPWGYGVEKLANKWSRRHIDPETEGLALLHHLDGWTALAFPDFSVDSRGGSKSVFVFEAILDYDAALARARELFPEVFERYSFEIVQAPAEASGSRGTT